MTSTNALRKKDDQKMSVSTLFDPKTVAVLGASASLDKFGGRVLHNLGRNGFTGRIVPINRGRDEVQGYQAVSNIGEVDGPVDVAILAVPADAAVDAVAECAAASVSHCIIIGTGFGEIGGAGIARQRRIDAALAGSRTRLLGPNCLGLINQHARLALSSSVSLAVGEFPIAGDVGFISQSGAHMVSVFDSARALGIALSAAVSVGNQADLEICDFLEHMISDASTRVICIYAEGFVDAQRFLLAAEACHEAGKPLFLVKVGRTGAGAAAAQSHTASLAGSYAVTAAACRERGVVMADDPITMIRAASAVARWGPPRSAGLAICSGSGGSISIAVDRVVGAGLRLAELSDRTCDELEKHVVSGHASNPVDLGFRRESDPVLAAAPIMSTLCADTDVGMIMLMLGSTPGLPEMTSALASAILATRAIPLVTVDSGEVADGARNVLDQLGCPHLDDVGHAVSLAAVLAAAGAAPDLVTYNEVPVLTDADLKVLARITDRLPSGKVTEAETKAVLAAGGVPTNLGVLARDEQGAIAAAETVGYPVVLKVSSADIVHKSDVGGVRLSLRSPHEVVAALRQMQCTFGDSSSVLVQKMIEAAPLEMIVGCRVDPQFGPIVLVGAGGTLAELFDDVQIALAPVGPREARQMLERLRVWPVLSGAHRNEPLDVDAVVDVMERLGVIVANASDGFVDLEINPLLVRERGAGVVAVDARATTRDRS